MSGDCLQKCRGTVYKSVGELSPKSCVGELSCSQMWHSLVHSMCISVCKTSDCRLCHSLNIDEIWSFMQESQLIGWWLVPRTSVSYSRWTLMKIIPRLCHPHVRIIAENTLRHPHVRIRDSFWRRPSAIVCWNFQMSETFLTWLDKLSSCHFWLVIYGFLLLFTVYFRCRSLSCKTTDDWSF